MGKNLGLELRLKEIRNTIKDLDNFAGKAGSLKTLDARIFLTKQNLSNSNWDMAKMFLKESENDLAICRQRSQGLFRGREEA